MNKSLRQPSKPTLLTSPFAAFTIHELGLVFEVDSMELTVFHLKSGPWTKDPEYLTVHMDYLRTYFWQYGWPFPTPGSFKRGQGLYFSSLEMCGSEFPC